MRKLLIANRGEIAIRIAHAAAELGIETLAVAPEDDAACLHVRRADAFVRLTGSGAAAYLDVAQLLAVAARDVAPPPAEIVGPVGRVAAGNAAIASSPDVPSPSTSARYVSVTVGSVTHSSATSVIRIPHAGPTILSPSHPSETPRITSNAGGTSSAVPKHSAAAAFSGGAPAGAVYRQ